MINDTYLLSKLSSADAALKQKYAAIEPYYRRIFDMVATHYKINPIWILYKTRKQPICEARQIVQYIIYQQTDLDWKSIAVMTGSTDHTTAIHSIRHISDLMQTEEDMRAAVTSFLNQTPKMLVKQKSRHGIIFAPQITSLTFAMNR